MTDVVNGRNFGYDPRGVFRFFDRSGMLFYEDGTWVRNYPDVGLWPVEESSPEPASPGIIELIEGDVTSGNGDLVAMVITSAYRAVSLCLEGIITPAHLEQATETDDTVDVPNVTIGGKLLLVRVVTRPGTELGTADKHGVILP